MKPQKRSILDDLPGYVAEVLDSPDHVASAHEATGLTPTPPATPAEAEAYQELVKEPLQAQKP